jgi:hypothetical protein
MKYKLKIKKGLREQSTGVDKSSFAILKTNDSEYILFDGKKLIDFCASLPKENPDFNKKDLVDNNVAIAYVKVMESEDLKQKYNADCMDATEISVAALNPNMKGSRLGEYLMRAIISMYPQGIIGDRGSISPSARATIKRLAGIAQVKTIKDPETGEKIDKLDNVKDPKTKTKKDDCPVYADLDSPFIDRAYIYKDPSINTQELINKSEEYFNSAAEATDNQWDPVSLDVTMAEAGKYLYTIQTQIA